MTVIHVQYSREKPPVWDELVKRFSPVWDRTAVAYGNKIHAAHELPEDVDVHERVHLQQQGGDEAGAKVWWAKYLDDPNFRYEQELQAYRAQYTYIKKTIKDRNEIERKLHKLSTDLATLYGIPIGYAKAREAIKTNK